jgi:hypothetical protein
MVIVTGLAMGYPVNSIEVFASVAPDPTRAQFGTYQADALWALANGFSSFGAYSQTTQFSVGQIISTAANPAPAPPPNGPGFICPAGLGCASDQGGIVLLGAAITSSQAFSLNDVSFQMTNFFNTTDPVDNLGADLGGFSDRVWGYDSTTNTWYTSGGDANTLVNSIYFVGFGDQFAIPNAADLPLSLNEIEGAANTSLSGTYTLTIGGVTIATGMAGAMLTPEPATYALAGFGLFLVGALAHRRRRTR